MKGGHERKIAAHCGGTVITQQAMAVLYIPSPATNLYSYCTNSYLLHQYAFGAAQL